MKTIEQKIIAKRTQIVELEDELADLELELCKALSAQGTNECVFDVKIGIENLSCIRMGNTFTIRMCDDDFEPIVLKNILKGDADTKYACGYFKVDEKAVATQLRGMRNKRCFGIIVEAIKKELERHNLVCCACE